jgi:hypothetical protein
MGVCYNRRHGVIHGLWPAAREGRLKRCLLAAPMLDRPQGRRRARCRRCRGSRRDSVLWMAYRRARPVTGCPGAAARCAHCQIYRGADTRRDTRRTASVPSVACGAFLTNCNRELVILPRGSCIWMCLRTVSLVTFQPACSILWATTTARSLPLISGKSSTACIHMLRTAAVLRCMSPRVPTLPVVSACGCADSRIWVHSCSVEVVLILYIASGWVVVGRELQY